MQWTQRNLLDIDHLSKDEILHIFKRSEFFAERNSQPRKKFDDLKGKTVLLFFSEASTRTRVSFDIAAKRLSADTFSLQDVGSSLQKGESLRDTVITLQAMHTDAIILRHRQSGAAKYIADNLNCAVINAGDGWHAHPTQALLDGFCLQRRWGSFEGKTILIMGDIVHSRVTRSNVQLFEKLGVKVRLCAPRTLLPKDYSSWPVEKVYTDCAKACQGVDAVMCLRLQLERQQAGLLPSISEYSRRFSLSSSVISHAKPSVAILHPGPMNRGVEIASSIADSANNLIVDQVSCGVAVRMALLSLYLNERS